MRDNAHSPKGRETYWFVHSAKCSGLSYYLRHFRKHVFHPLLNRSRPYRGHGICLAGGCVRSRSSNIVKCLTYQLITHFRTLCTARIFTCTHTHNEQIQLYSIYTANSEPAGYFAIFTILIESRSRDTLLIAEQRQIDSSGHVTLRIFHWRAHVDNSQRRIFQRKRNESIDVVAVGALFDLRCETL